MGSTPCTVHFNKVTVSALAMVYASMVQGVSSLLEEVHWAPSKCWEYNVRGLWVWGKWLDELQRQVMLFSAGRCWQANGFHKVLRLHRCGLGILLYDDERPVIHGDGHF